MDNQFPDLNSGVLRPVADEVSIENLRFTGELPVDLTEMLIRNGPNPFNGRFDGNDMLSWWVGPAMLRGLAITETRALFSFSM